MELFFTVRYMQNHNPNFTPAALLKKILQIPWIWNDDGTARGFSAVNPSVQIEAARLSDRFYTADRSRHRGTSGLEPTIVKY